MTTRAVKEVLLLVGPKGSGKSTIGQLLATRLGVRFVRVEPLFLELRAAVGPSHPDFERRALREPARRCIRYV